MCAFEIGAAAPLWKLYDQNERLIDVRHFLGKKTLLLSFHPLAWTPVCARQMKDLDRHFADFEKYGAVAFGLSVDSVPCKKAWADSLRITKTSLPSDFWPHGAVARMFGVFLERQGYAGRAAFIVDRSGTVAFRKVYPLNRVPDIREQMEKIAELARTAVS